MYSKPCLTNDKYVLMESALNRIDGMNPDTLNAIIALHQTVYKPQFESADGVVDSSIATVLTGTLLATGTSGLIAAIAGFGGGTALALCGSALAVIGAAVGLGYTVYETVKGAPRAYDEAKKYNHTEKAFNEAKSVIESNMENNPYAQNVIDAAKRTGEILLKSGGTLFDKVDAVSKGSPVTTTNNKNDASETLSDEEFAQKFGFTKDLQILDVDKASGHSLQYYYYINGMNEYGNKVIDEEAYKDYMDAFEDYWQEHRDFLPYIDEEGARNKMLAEFSRVYYKDSFMPAFKAKLAEAAQIKDKKKSVDELSSEGRNEFGDIVDKEKYYATMGFRPNASIIDMDKFSKAFTAKTGLDLSYNPVSPEGTRLLERMMSPSDEYLKYLPAPVFLMTKEDQKPFIERAKDPSRRGESQFGRYGNRANGNAVEQQTATNTNVAQQNGGNRQQGNTQKPSAQNGSGNANPVKSSGPWPTIGKARLANIYKMSPDKYKHFMRLGYIISVGDGKFYTMSDEDRKVMPQIVNEELDNESRQHTAERRQVKLNQGRLTRADMTPEEIAASNKRAGIPQGR